MKLKIGVVVFPGSNCDQDMVDALSRFPNTEVFKLWHKNTELHDADLIVLPGGFSYGDYLRSGAIARFSPVMESVQQFAAKGGYVLGVCNGFQILCESGLLPGALLHNDSHKFICENVFIRPISKSAPIAAALNNNEALCIPIAHGEGRYYIDAAGLAALKANDQILFRYCSGDGGEANPNGALEAIAGICNASKNVFGMMPHPERASDVILGNTDGSKILGSLLAHIGSKMSLAS
jgi:phosphoribosylformylglycinamidine synthase I